MIVLIGLVTPDNHGHCSLDYVETQTYSHRPTSIYTFLANAACHLFFSLISDFLSIILNLDVRRRRRKGASDYVGTTIIEILDHENIWVTG